MTKRMLGLLVLGVTASAGVSQADVFTLASGSQQWGNPNAWTRTDESTGRLPGQDDIAIANACCSSVYLADLDGKPITAKVRSFDGSGRTLYIDAGGVLESVSESQVRALTFTGGQLTTFSTFTVGTMTVNASVPAPSVMTTPNEGKIVLTGNTNVQGTLDFRGTHGEVRNEGTLTQSGDGNMSLWFGHDFRNRPGGIVDLRNDNGIAVKSPAPDVAGPTPIQFHNEAGATLSKSNGSGTSVVEAPIVNAGRISVSSGQLTLAGGGTHANGASLEASSAGAIGLQGVHTITGTVTTSGGGSIFLGELNKPGSMSIARGGTLSNSGSFFQSGTLTVESGGKLDQGQNGGFYAFSNLNVAAGGRVETAGLIQLEGALVNSGEVTVKGGGGITGIMGGGSYLQYMGSTSVEANGYFNLQGGTYQQDGGSTAIAAGGTMDLRRCDASTGECKGGTYLQTDGTTTVNGSLFAETVLFGDGELNGSGAIFGDVTIAPRVTDVYTGTISPGNSPGRLTIDGNFSATNAIFNIEIGGRDAGVDYDQLFVTGDAFIDRGLVNFRFIDGVLPDVGDIFDWLVAERSLVFENVPLFQVFSSIGTVYGKLIDGAFEVTVVERPGLPGQVPEPGTLALIVFGGLGMMAMTRRQRLVARGRWGSWGQGHDSFA